MDDKRKEWCKKYEINIADEGFIDKYCLPEHVKRIIPKRPGEKVYYIGLDGKNKTYGQLTEEEKTDLQEQEKRKPIIGIIGNQSKKTTIKDILDAIENIGKEPGE